MSGRFVMTIAAWEPPPAAFESDGNDIELAVVMGTQRFACDPDTFYFLSVNGELHLVLHP